MSPLGNVVRNQNKGEFCTKNKDFLEGKILAWRCPAVSAVPSGANPLMEHFVAPKLF